MKIKVGQWYKGKMSGTLREVVDIVQEGDSEHVETLIQMRTYLPNNVEYYSWWTLNELQKVCTLVEEE